MPGWPLPGRRRLPPATAVSHRRATAALLVVGGLVAAVRALSAAFGDGGEVSCGGGDTERRVLSVGTGATDGEVTVTVRAELRYRRNPFAHREIRPIARHRLANLHPWTPT